MAHIGTFFSLVVLSFPSKTQFGRRGAWLRELRVKAEAEALTSPCLHPNNLFFFFVYRQALVWSKLSLKWRKCHEE
jgi:hypothetical protein